MLVCTGARCRRIVVVFVLLVVNAVTLVVPAPVDERFEARLVRHQILEQPAESHVDVLEGEPVLLETHHPQQLLLRLAGGTEQQERHRTGNADRGEDLRFALLARDGPGDALRQVRDTIRD
uniref:Putative secreted peptide n=1 Tax=Anopheles braziliensis TaxID=58242 RepID=A0A2M3ZQ93_9DIPT